MVLCCFLVHFFIVSADFPFIQIQSKDIIVTVSAIQGILYLFYPLIGLLADAYFTRYKIIKVSVILQLVTSVLGVAGGVVWTIGTFFDFLHKPGPVLDVIHIFQISCVLVTILATGMFEATAIQFGMDQMMEVSSDQHSTFIHWYYFSMNFGVGLLPITTVGYLVILVTSKCLISTANKGIIHSIPVLSGLAALAFQAILAPLALFLLYRCKSHLTIEPAGHNPFVTVYKVLKYAWQHNCPENRSAFTYWEEDIPRRIDLGKNKYGGPFTTEEVEDTKTFFRLLLPLLTLFGFYFSGNGYSESRQLMHTMCPSTWVWMLVVTSPSLLNTLVPLVAIPVLQYILLPYFHRYIPSLLTRLGFGLAFTLLQEMAGILVVWGAWPGSSKCEHYKPHSDIIDCFIGKVMLNISGTCQIEHHVNYCSQGDSFFLWLLLPIVLRSFSYLLVFMTALEFICAQAPLRMKGLLIGLWYATSALRYLVVTILDPFIVENIPWFIFHGVRCFLILLSLLLYCCVAKHYRYRQRDEVVNEQYLVEEIYERRLRLAEEYEREKRKETRTQLDRSQCTSSYGSTDSESYFQHMYTLYNH